MKNRVTDFISSILDEVIVESKDKSYTPKKGDYVYVTRGAMTGECGEVTYVIPGGSMADVKMETGKIARVSAGHMTKEKKK
jgi:ribosomal protein L24